MLTKQAADRLTTVVGFIMAVNEFLSHTSTFPDYLHDFVSSMGTLIVCYFIQKRLPLEE
jgi:hypothetical protein